MWELLLVDETVELDWYKSTRGEYTVSVLNMKVLCNWFKLSSFEQNEELVEDEAEEEEDLFWKEEMNMSRVEPRLGLSGHTESSSSTTELTTDW